MFLTPQSQEDVIAELNTQRDILVELYQNITFTNDKISEQMDFFKVTLDDKYSLRVKMAEADRGLRYKQFYYGATILLVLLLYILYGIILIVIKKKVKEINYTNKVKPNKIKLKFSKTIRLDYGNVDVSYFSLILLGIMIILLHQTDLIEKWTNENQLWRTQDNRNVEFRLYDQDVGVY